MVAKIKKRKLQWTASQSPQVVAYKLYWAQGEKVGYDSPCTTLGKVTEVVLPDDVKEFDPETGPVEFGVTAVDELGNESDLVTVSAPHQFNAPLAPGELWIEGLKEKESDDSRPPKKESVTETETHISLLEHTIKGAGRRPGEDEKDVSSVESSPNVAGRHFGSK